MTSLLEPPLMVTVSALPLPPFVSPTVSETESPAASLNDRDCPETIETAAVALTALPVSSMNYTPEPEAKT